MNQAKKTKLFVVCCFVLLLTCLFSSGPAFGLDYTPRPKGDFLVVVSYPLWQASGGASGNFNQQLQTYILDLQNAGWTVKALLASTSDFTLPSFPYCNTYKLFYNSADPDWFELKEKIMYYLPNNCSDTATHGFVLIGSAPDIPTVYWRNSLKLADGKLPACHPTDIYYADRESWGDWELADQPLEPDLPGARGVVYTFKDANDNLYSSSEPLPDLIYGRISARTICNAATDPDRLVEEAGKIAAYLAKIHSYRANGSPLTPEQQNTAVIFNDDDFANTGSSDTHSAGELAGRLYDYNDFMVTNHENLAKNLERGSQLCFITCHSGETLFDMVEFSRDTYQQKGYGFTLDHINALSPKSHLYYLFSCSACRLSKPNIGATFLFNNDYSYNVIGKTSPDNVIVGKDLFSQLNVGETVGRAFYNDAHWIHDDFHSTGSCLALPSHILLGDPALTYARYIENRAPMFTNSFVSLEAKVGQSFGIPFSVSNPESVYPLTETYNITVEPIGPLPEGVSLNPFSWIPTANQAGKTYYFRATVTDQAGNFCQEEFSVYVNHFNAPFFENDSDDERWNMIGGGILSAITEYIPNTNPPVSNPFWFFHKVNRRTNYSIKFFNDYDSLHQNITVKPETYYNLAFYILNKTNRSQLIVRIPQLNFEYPVSTRLNTLEYVLIPVNSSDKSGLEVFIDIGDSSHRVIGELAISNIKLFDTGKSEMVYLSDLPVESGWVNKDGSFYGSTPSLDGQVFSKGLGMMAPSAVTYRLAGQYRLFTAYIGIDDIITDNGHSGVVFQVLADGQSIYQSIPLYTDSPIQFINLDVTGVNILELRVNDNGDGNSQDCGDWANAKLIMAAPVYLSDLEWASATAGSTGQIQKDKSFGDIDVGFNNPITINGVVYPKGIGTHANSTIVYNLNGQYSRFITDIGLDDELEVRGTSGYGTVRFEIWLDGVKQDNYDTVLNNIMDPRHISIDVTNVQELKLVVDDFDDIEPNDHADWAGAMLIRDMEHGLKAEYYQDKGLFKCVGQKVDKEINIVWGSASPGFGLGADNYSIRWSGKIKADSSGTYTFTTVADDGVKLWVNGQLIIDYWYPNGWNLQSGAITLEAGKYYDIRLEYFENTGNSMAHLMWSCNGSPIVFVPDTNLFVR